MAVHSKREDVDAIGACIGPRGSRVQVVIQELGNEKIDIFEWSENTVELIKNSLSPAQIIGVLQTREKKGLLVVVEDNQLSLAIGKKGKNARLAVRLTGQRIDIKSRTEMDKLDYDWKGAIQDYSLEVQAAILEKAAKKAEEERAKQRAEAEAIALEKSLREPEVIEEVIEPKAEPVVKVQEPVKVKKVKKPLERKTEYVSKFETLAEAAKPVAKVEPVLKRRPSKKEEEERKLRSSDIRKDKDYEIKIEYTAEELAEIEKQNAQAEPVFEEDIDYDQYDEFYEDEE
jgi:N utilization substance protein A